MMDNRWNVMSCSAHLCSLSVLKGAVCFGLEGSQICPTKLQTWKTSLFKDLKTRKCFFFFFKWVKLFCHGLLFSCNKVLPGINCWEKKTRNVILRSFFFYYWCLLLMGEINSQIYMTVHLFHLDYQQRSTQGSIECKEKKKAQNFYF